MIPADVLFMGDIDSGTASVTSLKTNSIESKTNGAVSFPSGLTGDVRTCHVENCDGQNMITDSSAGTKLERIVTFDAAVHVQNAPMYVKTIGGTKDDITPVTFISPLRITDPVGIRSNNYRTEANVPLMSSSGSGIRLW